MQLLDPGRQDFSAETGGRSAPGPIPAILLMNLTGKFIKQGGGKRRGAIAVAVEVWHGERLYNQQTPNDPKENNAESMSPGVELPAEITRLSLRTAVGGSRHAHA